MEYLLLILDFFKVKKGVVLVHLIIPAIIGIVIFYVGDDANFVKNASEFRSNTVTVLGILVGFSISIFTVFLTIDNENIRNAKSFKIKESDSITLYESVLIVLAYLIIIQGFLLIFNFIYPAFIEIESQKGKQLFAINISLLVHIIMLLMRNILDFYFILTKKTKFN